MGADTQLDASLESTGRRAPPEHTALYAWDAGTDSGSSYVGADIDTQPRQPIQQIDSGPLGNGTPLGTLTFTREDAPEPEALKLQNGRFEVTATWRDFNLTRSVGKPLSLTEDTGYFWFFSQNNVEVVIKVLDACTFGDRFWVFAGGLTSVEVELRVEDTQTGQVNVYANALGEAFQPIQDTDAFATCP